MYDLITIGSVSIDFYFKGKTLTLSDQRFQLALGGKYFTDYFHESLGGGAANVAIGAQKKGLRTAVMATIGDNDFKHFIKSALHKHSVSDFYCHVKDKYYNISAILLTEDGEKTVINFQSSNHNQFDHDLAPLKRAKAVYVGNAVEDKLKILKGIKNDDLIKFVCLGKKDCGLNVHELNEILTELNVLFVNGHEFTDLVKAQYERINFHENVAEAYMPILKNKILIITDGKNGSYGYFQGKVYHQKAVMIDKIIDSTGAGDAYSAGFIAKYYKTKNIEEAMERGAEYASVILQKVGAN